MNGTIAAVILAAGEGRRFGGRKQLAEIGGRSMLEHVIDLASDADLDPVVAVVPVWLTRPAGLADRRVRWVRNPYPERGLSHSLRLGFGALPASVAAAVVLLGDQPTMPRSQIESVIAARGDRPLVATRVDGHVAPPVLVEASHFGVAGAVGGDGGLRGLLAAHPEWVRLVTMTQRALDVDTPADLDALRDR
jgi:molybdenum cofactor cytidylyltransferase